MTEPPEAIGQVEAQMNKDIGDLAASPIKDEQGDSKDTAPSNGGHIEGHAHGKVVKPEDLTTGEMKQGEVDGKAAEKQPSAPGGGADQVKRQLIEIVDAEQTVNESSSEEDDLDDEEDESSDYTDETDTEGSEDVEDSEEED
nr:ribosomal L1 domain-containing protein CG13096-like [Rhipicephalus microplus]